MKDNVKSLFGGAKKHGAVLEQDMSDDEDEQQARYFGGRGHRLGDSSSPTTEDSQPAQPLQSAVRKKPRFFKVHLTVWKNGFTVQKGEDDDEGLLDFVSVTSRMNVFINFFWKSYLFSFIVVTEQNIINF